MRNPLKKQGQAMVEYLVLTVFLAIFLIQAVYAFRDGLKSMIKKGNKNLADRGQESTANRPTAKQAFAAKTFQKDPMPKWKSKYVPENTIWKLKFNTENGESENQYEPAQDSQ